MTNEEKASDIVINVFRKRIDFIPSARNDGYDCAMEMAEWKDKNPSKELVAEIFELSKQYLSYGGVVLDMQGNVVSPEDWIIEQLGKES